MLSRCAALGIIAGGFALTGDLNWVAAHGIRVINSHTVPTGDATPFPHSPAFAPPPATATDRTGAAVSSPAPPTAAAPAQPATAAEPPLPQPAPGTQAPSASADGLGHGPRPPAHGIDKVRVSSRQAGDRIIVWLSGSGGCTGSCLALDVIDPAAGEVIATAVASLAANGTARIAGPPRRLTVGDSASGLPGTTISRGAPLIVRAAGLAPAAGSEPQGVVTAILVQTGGR